MNIFDKTLIILFLAAVLASCGSGQSTPTVSDAEIMETAISTVSTTLAETQPALPTATQVPLTFTPTPAPESYLIVDSERMVRNGPGPYFPMIGTIEAQKKYRVIGKHNTPRVDWWLIDLGNNRSGWVTGVETRFVGNAEAVPDVAPSSTPYVPTSTPLAFTDPSIPLSERIVYYYKIDSYPDKPIPEGAVAAVAIHGRVVYPVGFLAPTYADETYTSDTAADLRTALELALHDGRNREREFEPEIVDVTFRFGHAKVRLQGEYEYYIPPSTSRDVCAPFVRSRMLILLTVFTNPAVQSAAVWLNEDTIGNLCSIDVKPADYVFTRAEIETYLKEHTYVTPSPIPPTPTLGPTSTPFVSIDPSLPLPELLPNAIDLQWSTAYGLPGDQSVTKIRPTRDGGFILVGDEVLLKLRADGFIEWQKSLGQVTALDVLETSTGDFILAGDRHWIKLDSQGNLLWQYTLERPSYHRGPILRFVEESNGNIVVEALFSRAVFNAEAELQSFTEYAMQWDSQTYPGNVRDRSGETLWAGGEYWVGKSDPNSSWLKVIPFPDTGIGTFPAYDIGPLIFIQGTADGGALVGVPFDEYPDPLRLNLLKFSYVLISRFSGDGSVLWQKEHGSDGVEEYEDFHAFETKSGDFIVAGTFIDFERGADVWMARLDRNGNSRWSKLYGTEGKDAVAVIRELSNGDLIFAGRTNGAGTGDQDMWVLKTNAQGEVPNCGLALGGGGSRARDISPEVVETIALEGVSVIEREVIPIFEDEPRPFGDVAAQVISLCSPSP